LNSELEVSFESLSIAQDIGARLKKHGGAALFIDYGHDRPSGNSLRVSVKMFTTQPKLTA